LAKKDVIIGLGEIGLPLFNLISKFTIAEGYDIKPELRNKPKFSQYENLDVLFLHICIPFSKNFFREIYSLYKKYNPQAIVIHSTVSPYTTKNLQKKLPIPVIYSATRGIHKRMLSDLKRYTKFYAIEPKAPRAKWASSVFSLLMKKCGIKTKKMSSTVTLELAKILVDTSYYGWLINYAQITNAVALQHKVSYDEMWSFSDEIHKLLGNRPKMYPGLIGGHCVIPNLDLIENDILKFIKKINSNYEKAINKPKKRKKFQKIDK